MGMYGISLQLLAQLLPASPRHRHTLLDRLARILEGRTGLVHVQERGVPERLCLRAGTEDDGDFGRAQLRLEQVRIGEEGAASRWSERGAPGSSVTGSDV